MALGPEAVLILTRITLLSSISLVLRSCIHIFVVCIRLTSRCKAVICVSRCRCLAGGRAEDRGLLCRLAVMGVDDFVGSEVRGS